MQVYGVFLGITFYVKRIWKMHLIENLLPINILEIFFEIVSNTFRKCISNTSIQTHFPN